MVELSPEALARAREIDEEILETVYGPDSCSSDVAAAWPLARIIAALEERVSQLENQ